jgi:hypothetical protein
MKLIKLTNLKDKSPIYVNAEMIGHIYEVEDKYEYGRITEEAHTKVAVLTHNNGGFKVQETLEIILSLLK